MLALGLGANGVCPYVMVEVICVEDYETDVGNLCAALTKGIEKVISTIGIHEVRGYARQFSSIGVKPELAEIFQTKAFAATEKGGTGFAELDEDTNERVQALSGDDAAAKTGEDLPLLPEGLQVRDRHRERLRHLRGVLAEGPRPGAAEPDLDAPHHGAEGGSRPDRAEPGRRRRWPPRLSDRDLLDELRLAVRTGLPRLRRRGQGDQTSSA